MTEIDRLWIKKNGDQWAPEHPGSFDPEKLYSEETLNKSLESMHEAAVGMRLRKGVAFVAIWPFFAGYPRVAFNVVGAIERQADPNRKGDAGSNYFGIAMSKLAFMLSTHTDSGSKVRTARNGEVDYRGGLTVTTKEGTAIYIGYSGGTEDQDVQIAQKGFKSLVELSEAGPTPQDK